MNGFLLVLITDSHGHNCSLLTYCLFFHWVNISFPQYLHEKWSVVHPGTGWLMQRPGEVRCRVLRMARNRLSDTSLVSRPWWETWSMKLGRSGYGSIPIDTIFSGMNIHLPAILMFTRGTRFWHTAISEYILYIISIQKLIAGDDLMLLDLMLLAKWR